MYTCSCPPVSVSSRTQWSMPTGFGEWLSGIVKENMGQTDAIRKAVQVNEVYSACMHTCIVRVGMHTDKKIYTHERACLHT